ncbi:hypothetical protein T265_11488 [Opisthorchis viverrini]|uniref:Uncharacterized protein n=1 Tax=Opisthorchis viverrini TaxID=6198 RepID=A0A074YYU2_OPIVI|nr:hypothetical protein T265_11488 [Opisthorchis viverrini]KER19833.1 hypothetical protein T265_11488 [Opisthorchis viverrini]
MFSAFWKMRFSENTESFDNNSPQVLTHNLQDQETVFFRSPVIDPSRMGDPASVAGIPHGIFRWADEVRKSSQHGMVKVLRDIKFRITTLYDENPNSARWAPIVSLGKTSRDDFIYRWPAPNVFADHVVGGLDSIISKSLAELDDTTAYGIAIFSGEKYCKICAAQDQSGSLRTALKRIRLWRHAIMDKPTSSLLKLLILKGQIIFRYVRRHYVLGQKGGSVQNIFHMVTKICAHCFRVPTTFELCRTIPGNVKHSKVTNAPFLESAMFLTHVVELEYSDVFSWRFLTNNSAEKDFAPVNGTKLIAYSLTGVMLISPVVITLIRAVLFIQLRDLKPFFQPVRSVHFGKREQPFDPLCYGARDQASVIYEVVSIGSINVGESNQTMSDEPRKDDYQWISSQARTLPTTTTHHAAAAYASPVLRSRKRVQNKKEVTSIAVPATRLLVLKTQHTAASSESSVRARAACCPGCFSVRTLKEARKAWIEALRFI